MCMCVYQTTVQVCMCLPHVWLNLSLCVICVCLVFILVCVWVCYAPGVSSAGQLMGICAWSSGSQPANWANWATSASHCQLCHWMPDLHFISIIVISASHAPRPDWPPSSLLHPSIHPYIHLCPLQHMKCESFSRLLRTKRPCEDKKIREIYMDILTSLMSGFVRAAGKSDLQKRITLSTLLFASDYIRSVCHQPICTGCCGNDIRPSSYVLW